MYLEIFFSRFGLRSNLAQDVTSTHLNAQIDGVFSNVNNIEADVYETYLSYHKPIYVSLPNNDRTTQRFNIKDVEKSHETHNIENYVPLIKTTLITTVHSKWNYISEQKRHIVSENMFIEIASEIILKHWIYFNDMRSEIFNARNLICNLEIDSIDKHIEIKIGELNSKLKIICITGDGNCTYQAISYCLSHFENIIFI